MKKNRSNIILISLDTVRADHLSCYGYPKPTTPNIDSLAEDGVLFENAYSTSGWTPPAHASMLTGLYPSEHGVVDQNRLHPNIPTIAEILSANGYQTAGFVNNSQVGQLVGLDKGHETFVELWRGINSRYLIVRSLRYFRRKCTQLLRLSDNGARLTNRLAIKWIDEVHNNERPFYLFLHYIEAHNPLNPPVPYRTRFLPSRLSHQVDRKKLKLMADNPLRYYTQNLELSEEENKTLIAKYDGEIAYLDNKLGELLQYLKKIKLYDNTCIILTSDHGEHFGENGNYSHVASLYQPIIHVPMIVKLPNSASGPKTVPHLVQVTDILPTCTALAEINTLHSETIQGKKTLLPGSGDHFHDHVICEWEGRIPYFILNELACDKTDQKVARFLERKTSILDNTGYKLIITTKNRIELYNIKADPQEKTNIAHIDFEKVKKLKYELKKWKANIASKETPRQIINIDSAVKSNLQALGYL